MAGLECPVRAALTPTTRLVFLMKLGCMAAGPGRSRPGTASHADAAAHESGPAPPEAAFGGCCRAGVCSWPRLMMEREACRSATSNGLRPTNSTSLSSQGSCRKLLALKVPGSALLSNATNGATASELHYHAPCPFQPVYPAGMTCKDSLLPRNLHEVPGFTAISRRRSYHEETFVRKGPRGIKGKNKAGKCGCVNGAEAQRNEAVYRSSASTTLVCHQGR